MEQDFYCFLETKTDSLKKQIKDLLDKKPQKNNGILIAFEGIDGASKTTTSESLVKWLESENYDVVTTKWSDSSLLKKTIKKAKSERLMTPMLYSLLHASDFIVRYNEIIKPALEKNKIVVSDRYFYTSLVRDKARGVDIRILNEIYENYRIPDLLFHCVIPIHTALERLLKNNPDLSYYGSGMDLKLSPDRKESYIRYEHIIDKIYRKILPSVPSYHKLSTDRSPDEILKEVKKTVKAKLGLGNF